MLAAGRASGTVRLHRHYLSQLRTAHEKSPWTATTSELRELLANPAWSPDTRKSCRTVLRGFYRWAHSEGVVRENPALPLLPIRVTPGVPRPTPERIVEEAVGSGDARVEFMARLAAFCGLRVGEISRVHERDIVELLGATGLAVHGKGGKMRVVPVEDRDLATLLDGLDGWAFPNGLGSHLSPGHVSRLMSRALPGKWTAHTLRHRCATVALECTGDIYAVSTMLGHSRLETTQIYARLPQAAVRRAVAAASRIQSSAA